jgi:mannan endo-1,4-beta-mannosidase
LASPRRAAFLVATTFAAVLTVVPTVSAAAPRQAAAVSASGFVGRNGTQLVLDGQPWNFAGYNLPCQQPFTMSSAQLQYYFEDIAINSRANVVRMWWFQSDMGTGANPWAPFDQVVAAAKAVGVRIIPALTNQWQTCDEPSPATPEKELPWYQGGYQQAEGGYTLSYQQFATEMAAHFANEPTIAFWQLVNEAEAPSSTGCDETAAASAMRSFADTMANAVHAVDPHHLVNLGTQGAGECGTAGSDYSYVQAGSIDLCEVHDYTNPTLAMPTGPSSLSEDIAACHALGKPIFIGEAGIPANVQPDGSSGSAPITLTTIDQRAAFFKAKIDAFDAAGGVGYVIWFKSPFYTTAEDSADIPDGDPTEAVLGDALTVADPPNALPEFSWPAGALLLSVLLMGGAVAVIRRRHRPATP